MKRITIIIFLFFIIQNSYSNEKITTLVLVDNLAITNIDLQNEVKLLNTLNSQNKLDVENKNTKKIIIENLINETLKSLDIKKNNIKIDKLTLDNEYNKLIEKISNNKIILPEILKNSLYKKIKIDYEWNLLINKIYSWKVSININEVEDKIKKLKKENLSDDKLENIKNNLIEQERKKKLVTFSNLHLKKLKEQYNIKFIK